jgi:transcriptional regulator with XRE-family HTH domain
VSRQVISRIERGQLASASVRTLIRLTDALDASVDLTVRWQGEQLDRLVDAAHAHVVELTAVMLQAAGWLTRAEVSFNHYGDRGRVDLLAFHPALRTLVVSEAKSAIGDTQDTVGRLDVKTRLGPMLAESIGWGRPSAVVPALVIGESRTARRVIQRHQSLFAQFSIRGRSAVAWLRSPSDPAPSGLLWFTNVPDSLGTGVTRGKRVRPDRTGP